MPSIMLSAALGLLALQVPLASAATDCDSINGYTCNTDKSRQWGEYSPYWARTQWDSNTSISNEIPNNCAVTQVSLLNRHGARYPTTSKGADYATLIETIHNTTTSYSSAYAFIKNLTYDLGTNNLTPFGEQELVFSGEKFFQRYQSLAQRNVPFVRADSAARTIMSAENFTLGYAASCAADSKCTVGGSLNPNNIEILTASATLNDTLDPDNCYEYENGYESKTNNDAEADWEAVFIKGALQNRVNSNLVGANLTVPDIVYLMDLCPFYTVANIDGTPSAFCSLFTDAEWKDYNYLRTLDKWYGDGPGNNLGPAQGIGYANELVARMTNNRSRALADETNVNHTLDASNATFPLDIALYADFSHDDPMYSIFTALGLFNVSAEYPANPSNTTWMSEPSFPYSSAHTVPFAGRAYFERLTCSSTEASSYNGTSSGDTYVRVLINDAVVPLQNCGANALGMCLLDDWVASLSRAASNGNWAACAK